MQQEVGELLAWVGLEDHQNELPSTLSGGQKQRASIARAVVIAPKILLADEPTGNVDDEMALRLMQLFVELNKVGTTLLIATHDTRWVDRYAAPQLHLNDGRLSFLPSHQPLAIDP